MADAWMDSQASPAPRVTSPADTGSPTLPVVSVRHSLRRRLPALIFGLLGLLGLAFAWSAYEQVKGALRVSGTERITSAAQQVAELLSQSASARMADTRRLAADPDVRRMALTGETEFNAGGSVGLKAFADRNPLATVWLYDAAGRRVGRLGGGTGTVEGTARSGPATAPPQGPSPLRSEAQHVWYYTTVPIEPTPADPRSAVVSIQRPLGSAQATALIERLIGSGAELKFGNASGDVWTDLSAPTTAPPSGAPDAPVIYPADNGEDWVGIVVPVSGTPWLVWVAVAEKTMLIPARTLLRRMVPITLILMALGSLAVYGVSGRITKPLEVVARAAESMAAGDYTRRVDIERQDEVGRLGTAFNVMAARVQAAHESLERRVAERTHELEQAREELDRFFSISLDLLCIAGNDGRFRRVNPAWEEVVGWSQEDLLARPYLDFVHPDDRAITAVETASLAKGATTLSFENRYRCKDGSYRWLSWKAVPLPAAGLVYAVARDVTEQKTLERALHRHGSDLENANRELEAFSYSVSHDLRAPLRHVAGFAALLHKHAYDRLDEQGRRYLDTISDAAKQMGRLVDDLLGFSRMARADMLRDDVDLGGLVRELIDEVGRDTPERHVTWTIGDLPDVVGDRAMLRVAFGNVVRNAYKYTSKREIATIEIGAAASANGERIVYVQDNGAGFDMAYAGKLFGVFQRLHSAEDFEGTGIGLANVRRILQRHGGRTWAEGEVDRGATFYLAFPATGVAST